MVGDGLMGEGPRPTADGEMADISSPSRLNTIEFPVLYRRRGASRTRRFQLRAPHHHVGERDGDGDGDADCESQSKPS